MLKNFIAVTFLFNVINTTLAQQTEPANQNRLPTRWSKEIDAEHVLPEYPRPQLQRKNWINLNGKWDYAIADSTGIPKSYNGQILVPFPLESALSGVGKVLMPSERLWYRTEFNSPELKKGEKLMLNFGAVDWQAEVFINDIPVGSHTGGYTAFSFDITRYLKNKKNKLVVKVYDPTDQGINPHGKQVLKPSSIYYTASSGIWQTVWLEKVPQTYINAISFNSDIDDKSIEIKTNTSIPGQSSVLEIAVFDHNRLIKKVLTKPDQATRIEIPNAKLWSPQNPNLYDLKIRLKVNSKTIDEVSSYFGMRKVEIKKDENGYSRIFLNNQYVYNLGVLDQGFWPDGLYTAPSDEALAFDIRAIRNMGFNTIRKHIKIEPARWYYHADKIGMLVWQDLVNPPQNLPEGSKDEFESESKEIVRQLHNYPSIIAWTLFNERWGAYDQGRLTTWLKQLDPQRLINGHSGELLYVNDRLRDTSSNPYMNSDFTDVHSYPGPRNPIQLPGKAMVLGEFGGIGVSITGHIWDDLSGWGYVNYGVDSLLYHYGKMMKEVKELEKKGLSASIYTEPFDVEIEQNGLMTYDRKIVKIPFRKLREINQSLVLPLSFTELSGVMEADSTPMSVQYQQLKKNYQSGLRDSAFLRQLALAALSNKDSLMVSTASDAYLHIVQEPLGKENLRLFSILLISSNSELFRFFEQKSAEINKISGSRYAEEKLMTVISNEEIVPNLRENNKPDWSAILKKAETKFGLLGKEKVLGMKTIYFYQHKNWDLFCSAFYDYFSQFGDYFNSDVYRNNFAWKVFQYGKERKVLTLAAVVMDPLTSQEKLRNENPIFYAVCLDTKANLLYKSGKVADAIALEQAAITVLQAIGRDTSEFSGNIKKMQQNIPTW